MRKPGQRSMLSNAAEIAPDTVRTQVHMDVLRAMDSGAALVNFVSTGAGTGRLVHRESEWSRRVNPLTIAALVRHGWITLEHTVGIREYYAITEEGRVACASK